MFRETQFLFVNLLLALTLCGQTPRVQETPEDKVRKELNDAYKAFLSAHPDLESTLTRGDPSELHKKIGESRNLALALAEAKGKLYDELVRQANAEVRIISGEKRENPAQIGKERQASIARRKDIEQDSRIADDAAADIRKRLEGASATQRERLQLDLNDATDRAEALRSLASLLNAEIAELVRLENASTVAGESRDKIMKAKEKERDEYQKLREGAKLGGQQYKEYFDKLDQFVDGRGRKGTPK